MFFINCILLITLFFLSACGLTPMYGHSNQNAPQQAFTTSAALNKVRINALPDREGQYLRNALIDRFYGGGYPQAPLYSLEITPLREGKTAFDITVESEATRYQLKISTTMKLADLKTNQLLLNRPINAVSSYNVLESEFATRVSEQNAREAILDDLARQIEQHIALFLNQ